MAGKSDENETQASPISVESLASAIASIAQSVATLSDKVEILSRQPAAPALVAAQSPDQLLAGVKSMQVGEEKHKSSFRDQFGRTPVFHPDQMVELIDLDKLQLWYKSGRLAEGAPLFGIVISLMYWSKRGACPKYKVDFGSGFGSDGVMETQIRRAN